MICYFGNSCLQLNTVNTTWDVDGKGYQKYLLLSMVIAIDVFLYVAGTKSGHGREQMR